MIVKMNETVQGRDVKGILLPDQKDVDVLHPDKTYRVADAFGKWLVENGKAKETEQPESTPIEMVTTTSLEIEDDPEKFDAHYGGQEQPQERHDEEIHDVMTSEDTPKRSKRRK